MTMAITLTESAARQIKNQLAGRGKGLGLRVGVKKVGCSGFAYTFDYADEVREGDRLFESHDATIVVAAESLAFLDCSRLNFVKDGLKQMFSFDNPNVDNTCGCGESFSLNEANKRYLQCRKADSDFGECRSNSNEHGTAKSRQSALQARVRHRNRVRCCA